jgi:AraC-like DNA-binding protein
MDISIGQLAVKLDVKEHHLRRVINSGLGYRNFNDFLNCYRIQETSARLSDPEIAKLPILTIALDAGFRSLSTFNKAFKDTHQLTPTEFRKKSLTIS